METDTYSENNVTSSKGGKSKAGAKTGGALGPHNTSKSKKTIEETYQKLSQLEHILLRPDTYIGSTEKQPQCLWVHDGERMVLKSVNIAPGLYKIFDEILVNASDNKVRDPTMDTLRVDVDVEKGEISVLNNGAGIPVEVHKTEGIYVPELIFGNLLTSSNYNDNEKKVTGGRNGYGAKLANIFSTEFVVETCDGKRKRRYKQTFRSNMTQKGAPRITDCKPTDNWTCISFKPDLERFGMETLEEDTVALIRKRVYDIAGILGKTVKVYLNGQRLPIKDFQSYIDLYLGPRSEEGAVPRVYERFGDRWEVCVAATEGVFNQVSFVNSICTSKGGTHVNYLADQVVKYVCELLGKKHKQTNVKPFMVKSYLSIFVNCQIENPAFDSQTKDTLTLRASAFGSKCELPDPFLKKVAAAGVTDAVLNFANQKANKELKKGDGAKRQRLTGIPKLDDANDAGGVNSDKCTLILTEGDSAKSLAISGLSVVGRDRFGVFPLRGKLLNVREASTMQITGNAEIQNIKQILGLQHGKQYKDTKSLRYGHLMIMTDQDHDGSHIKGLIMNYFHTFYPSLLRLPGFLVEFITPIIKVTKGRQSISFFTLPEYETWCKTVNTRGWMIKYYKGLGTSTSAEAKEYFANIQSHRKEFVWEGDQDGTALEMAFSKKRVDERKEWLRSFVPGTFLDHSADSISYQDFVDKELILFSRADLERSIPSMVDGLKPGQRKILYACFKRNLRSDIKVAQLAGYVAEHSAYHHGEASLMSTIVGLAQDFVGTNNINLLVPQGQFGTRLQGGKDAASPRYIFTRLATLTRHLFNEEDDNLLKYLDEEGQRIEPESYVPILPTVLINGAEGIGTGWSTSVPNYNPRDVVNNLKRMLAGQEPEPMAPWYRGFKGTIQEMMTKTGRSYLISGVVSQVDDTTLEISELPVRKWTQDYKEFLEELAKPVDKNVTPLIVDYKEHHTDDSVRFVVTLTEAKMREALAAGLHAKFKLTTKVSIGNMMLFGPDGIIKKYNGPEDVIQEFYGLRMGYYIRRKASLLRCAEAELLRISNKVRFILAVVKGSIKLSNRKRADIEAQLEKEGYDRLPSTKKAAAEAAASADTEGSGSEGDTMDASAEGSYEYLLLMPLASLTLEKVQALQQEAADKEVEVAALRDTTEADMWAKDLDAFLHAYEEFEAEEARRESQLARQQACARKGQTRRGKKATKKKPAKKGKGKKRHEWSDEEDELSDTDDEDFMSDDDDVISVPAAAAAAKRPALPQPRGRVIPPPPVPTFSATTTTSTQTSSRGAAGAKKGVGAAKGKSKASASQDTSASSPPPPAPPAVEEMSLVQRMAMRMGALALDNGTTSSSDDATSSGDLDSSAAAAMDAVAKAAAPGPGPLKKPTQAPVRRAGRAAAAVAKQKASAMLSDDSEEDSDAGFSCDDDDSDEEFDLMSDDGSEVMSPMPAARKPAAHKGGKNAGPSRLGPGAGAKRATAVTANGISTRADVVLDGGSPAGSVPSPAAAAPDAKVQRIRPSPFHKGSGKAKTSKATAKAGKANTAKALPKGRAVAAKNTKKQVAESDDDDEDHDVIVISEDESCENEQQAVVPRSRAPARRTAAIAKPKYAESDEAEEEEELLNEVTSASEGEDDYVPSD